MNQYDFEAFLDRHPKLSGVEAVGRFVKNAFGVDEKVILPEAYWRYADWLVEFEQINIPAYIADCDKERPQDITLSEHLMEGLYFDMKERERMDMVLPRWLRLI